MNPFYAQRIQAPVPAHGSLSPSSEEVESLEKAGVRPMHNMDPVLLEELHQLQQLMLKAPGRHLPPLNVDF